MTIIVRQMTLEDFEDGNRVLRDHFYGKEPVTQTPGFQITETTLLKLNKYQLSCISQGTALVAVDQREAGKIVGVAYAAAMQPSDLEKNWQDVNQSKKKTEIQEHFHYFVADLNRKSNFFEHFGISNALYLKMIAVDFTVVNQGVGRRLIMGLIEVGRAKGFPLLVAICTSLYAQKIMAKLGGECIMSIDYVDYKDEDGNVILKPPAPHTKASVMAIKL